MIKVKRPTSRDDFIIDVAPLVDVLFTLLIFFSLTSSFLRESGIKVTLPEAKTGNPIEHTRRIEIAIPPEGHLIVNDVATTPEELKRMLGTIDFAERNKYLVVVKGDVSTSHGRVTMVLDMIKGLGFREVAIATRSKR